MMYGTKNAKALDINKPVITKIDSSEYIPNRSYLSGKDVETINALYKPIDPVITTLYVNNIASNQATSGINVIFDGRPSVEMCGVCWSSEGIPTIDNHKTFDGIGLGTFISTLNDLNSNTTYYVRAYATDRNYKTFYGNLLTFTTKPNLPTVSFADNISAITQNSALCGVVVSEDGGAAVTTRGVCWSTAQNPTISSDNKTTDGFGTGSFISNITRLESNTTYYVRAYATNSAGTAYSNTTLKFTTLIALTKPIVTTSLSNSITTSSATINGEVISDGGSPVTQRGFYWCKDCDEPYEENYINVVTGTIGKFSHQLTGLQPKTRYAFKAFATNSVGTETGNVFYLTTDAEPVSIPTVSTSAVKEITQTTATSGGNITSNGGSPVMLRGVCWDTNEEPTVNNNTGKSIDGGGTGTWVSELTGLQPGTTYYLRAYAVNSIETVYGIQFKFTTIAVTAPQVSTLFASSLTQNSAVLNGNVSSDGGSVITERGFYWSIGDNYPGTDDNVEIVDGTTGSFNKQLNGLLPATQYSFTAFAKNSEGVATGSTNLFVTDAPQQVDIPVLTAPSNLSVFNRKNTAIVNIQWAAVNGANDYWLNVFPSGQAGSPVFDEAVGNNTSKNIGIDNVPNGVYIFHVRAKATGGQWSGYSDAREFVADTPPGAPAILSPANESAITQNTQQNFSWDAPSAGIHRYYLRIVSGTDLNGTAVYEGEPTSTNQNINCNWTAGTYTWSVRGIKETPDTYSPTEYENNIGWGAYAPLQTFSINAVLALPTVTTSSITNITQTTATSGGNVTSDGGATVTARGVCWSTAQNPTTASSKTTNGTGTGSFTSNLTGLTANTPYYVRAYATNSAGTAYGNEVTFTIGQAITQPTVTTSAITEITQTTATGGGNVTADGGATVTARGVCWNTSPNPTTSSSKTTNGTGTGSFTSNLTGLTANTPYYVRAYATNSQGTAYGEQTEFRTLEVISGELPRDTETAVVDVTNPATGKIWMDRNLGASRAATSSTDSEAYGDLYQWGRAADGHQNRSSLISTVISTTDMPGHGNFITATYISNYDWRFPQNSNLWQGVSGVNNPCPNGYRLPTEAEWDAERQSWSSNNAEGAINSPMKLPVAGNRKGGDGALLAVGSNGDYWSSTSTLHGNASHKLYFQSDRAGIGGNNRSVGSSVRCIKGLETSISFPTVNTVNITKITHFTASGGGNVTSNGGASVTARGLCWNTIGTPTITDNKTTDGSGTGSFTSNLVGLSANTTYYVRAYATNSQGTAYGEQTEFRTLEEISGEWTRDTETAVVDVTNPATGKTWMDRNLGASRTAIGSTDTEAYGDLYQWGRAADGHEKRNSQKLSTLSTTDTPGHGSFILSPNYPYDWHTPENHNLWQGLNGSNNPCPNGYRLPTEAEWNTEMLSWSSNNANGAFASPLKLPMAGTRYGDYGSLGSVGLGGRYWSSTVSVSYSQVLLFSSGMAYFGSGGRAYGYSIRCLKN